MTIAVIELAYLLINQWNVRTLKHLTFNFCKTRIVVERKNPFLLNINGETLPISLFRYSIASKTRKL